MTAARPSLRETLRALPRLAQLNLALLAAAILGLSTWLWPEWRENPDLSHGLFMPFVFLWLCHESRHGTARYLSSGLATRLAFGLLLAAGLASLALAGLYAAAVDWSHPLVDFMLTLSLTATLGAAVVAWSRDSRRLIPFNWSSVCAVALWAMTAPLPPGTYARLTLNLQLWVSEGVLRTLHLLGIAAIRHGNVIDLANTSVGVEEACSGVRSLLSCVFAGIFFSATLVRRPWARVFIIALSAPLALGMNFLRSLALTLMANRQIDISGAWHDVTGFAVLGITAVILGGIALALDRAPRASAAAAPPLAPGRPPRLGLDPALAAGLGLAAALVCIFIANTRPSPRTDVPVPDLFALLPASAAGWEVKTSNLYEFRGALKTEHLAQRHYVRTSGGPPLEIIVYVAYWRAGQAPVSLVASHTPDACWPGSGWIPQPTPAPHVKLTAGARTLADAEHRVFLGGEHPQHVWFWHLYDGRPIPFQDPYSPVALLRLAVAYGFRRAGDQLFVRVSSNRPWPDIAREPLLADFFARTQPHGL